MRDYYLDRASRQRLLSLQCTDVATARLHFRLAEEYLRLARDPRFYHVRRPGPSHEYSASETLQICERPSIEKREG